MKKVELAVTYHLDDVTLKSLDDFGSGWTLLRHYLPNADYRVEENEGKIALINERNKYMIWKGKGEDPLYHGTHFQEKDLAPKCPDERMETVSQMMDQGHNFLSFDKIFAADTLKEACLAMVAYIYSGHNREEFYNYLGGMSYSQEV